MNSQLFPDPNIKDKIVGMFQYGHGASTSIKVHLLDLLMINEEQYFNLIHNGSYMPSVSQVSFPVAEITREILSLKQTTADWPKTERFFLKKNFSIPRSQLNILTEHFFNFDSDSYDQKIPDSNSGVLTEWNHSLTPTPTRQAFTSQF